VDIVVSYTTGDRSRDEKHKVAVLFKEEDAPKLILQIHSRVRHPITVAPERLTFRKLGRGQSQDGAFEIWNYGDVDWASIDVESSVDWVTVSVELIEGGELPEGARQLWRATPTIAARELEHGDHEAKLWVRPDGSSERSQPISVFARVVSPVFAAPGQLFFGTVGVGESSSCDVSLHFAPGAAPAGSDAVTVKHPYGSQLVVAWEGTHEDEWKLKATVSPNSTGLQKGSVTIAFVDDSLPILELPVFARVKEPR